MILHECQVRVRYADTDQMTYVYHGKYVEYLEVGRTEMIRDHGIPYAEVENRGILMPVASLDIHFKRPAFYDDLLTIRTIVKEIPKASFTFDYEILREDKTLVLEARVKLAFVDKTRMRPVRAPEYIRLAVEELLEAEQKG